ncbi:thiolase family protein [Jatrophihabitans sp. DSM 45814]
MTDPVIVAAARTAVATSRKGALANTSVEDLATWVLAETVRRSGLDPQLINDVIFADSGSSARWAAIENGLMNVPGQSVGRACAGSLTAIGNGAGSIKAGMDSAIVAGGVYSASTNPRVTKRVLGTVDEWAPAQMMLHSLSDEAPTQDVAITVGHSTAVEAGISREEMDAWAYRSHQRAMAAIDAGKFVDEIFAIKVPAWDGSIVEFAVDEHPRRDTSMEKLASLKVLHPEIENYQITAGNSSGVNDAAAAVAMTSAELAAAEGLVPMAKVKAWCSAAVHPGRTGFGALEATKLLLKRSGYSVDDIALWEINEAFASVPIAVCKDLGINDELVNVYGSGCSIGHPISASGARMINTLVYELQRRGGGLGVASMCAAAGQGGAVLIEV